MEQNDTRTFDIFKNNKLTDTIIFEPINQYTTEKLNICKSELNTTIHSQINELSHIIGLHSKSNSLTKSKEDVTDLVYNLAESLLNNSLVGKYLSKVYEIYYGDIQDFEDKQYKLAKAYAKLTNANVSSVLEEVKPIIKRYTKENGTHEQAKTNILNMMQKNCNDFCISCLEKHIKSNNNKPSEIVREDISFIINTYSNAILKEEKISEELYRKYGINKYIIYLDIEDLKTYINPITSTCAMLPRKDNRPQICQTINTPIPKPETTKKSNTPAK